MDGVKLGSKRLKVKLKRDDIHSHSIDANAFGEPPTPMPPSLHQYGTQLPPPTPPYYADPMLREYNPPFYNSNNSSTEKGPTGANLFVYHLPCDLTDAYLLTIFAPFGEVLSAKVYHDKHTGQSKGFGFVSFGSPQGERILPALCWISLTPTNPATNFIFSR